MHFMAFFYLGRPSAAIPLAMFVPLDLFISVVGLTAYRVLMVWVYDGSGESLLLAMLMHASYSACTFIFGPVAGPGAMSGSYLLAAVLASAAATWVVVAVLAVATHGHLSRQPPLPGRRVA